MSDMRTYSEYLAEGYKMASAYYAEGEHFHVLQNGSSVIVVKIAMHKLKKNPLSMNEHSQIIGLVK